eukprot:TRINITY_DN86501_c0_g1_i1.p1 TRINITY_DN86501_c0_g1~~TRINITY_DN86501_c0_g1_i1.p1  ORF type:complete len:222 (+),score=13.22 TRINITY_DN86501_c0_g1_i1:98-763(+)
MSFGNCGPCAAPVQTFVNPCAGTGAGTSFGGFNPLGSGGCGTAPGATCNNPQPSTSQHGFQTAATADEGALVHRDVAYDTDYVTVPVQRPVVMETYQRLTEVPVEHVVNVVNKPCNIDTPWQPPPTQFCQPNMCNPCARPCSPPAIAPCSPRAMSPCGSPRSYSPCRRPGFGGGFQTRATGSTGPQPMCNPCGPGGFGGGFGTGFGGSGFNRGGGFGIRGW